MKFIPYAKQSINDQDLEACQNALKKEMITRGDLVEQFEQEICHYCDAQYGVAFNSGTTALFAAAAAAQINSFDHLLTTPNTFIATATCAWKRGAQATFIDIDVTTGNLDRAKLKQSVHAFQSSRGRPIIFPVHFAGTPLDMKEIYHEYNPFNTVIIEDAAHALGSTYPSGEKVGSCAYSDMTILSFHPAKTITTGEGGMVLTNDATYFERLKLYRNNGINRDLKTLYPGYYEVEQEGGNFNFTEFQAALGLTQLKRIDTFLEKRKQLVALYRENLKDLPNVRMLKDSSNSAHHLFVILIDFKALKKDRESVMKALLDKSIGTQVHYIPLYHHPIFKHLNIVKEDFPNMEEYFSQALTLPLYYDLTEKDVEYVVQSLKSVLSIR